MHTNEITNSSVPMQAQRVLVDNLTSSEAHYRAILEAAVDSIITIDEAGIIQSANAATFKTFCYQPEELIGQNVSVLMPAPYSIEHDSYLSKYLKTRVKRIIGIGREVVGKRKDGSLFPMELSVSEVNLPGRLLFTGIVRDIADRKQVEEALLAERNRIQQYLDIAAVIVISLDLDGRVQLINRYALELLGIAEGAMLGRSLEELLPEDNSFLEGLDLAKRGGQPHRWESPLHTAISKYTISWHSSPLTRRDGALAGVLISGADITELARAKQSLTDAHHRLEARVAERTEELAEANTVLLSSLKEKEVLLKEIHHRVKNNLQLISSLLSLQVRSRKGMSIEQLVYEIQGRIQSIALLHEMLYQSGDLVHVDLAKYIDTLAKTIVRYFGMSSRIDLTIETDDSKLSLDASIYCGLLLNELITNAMKHAFPGERRGVLKIVAKRFNENRYLLAVSDDGVGLPANFDIANATSLGLELVQQLTAKLRGELTISGDGGSAFQLHFQDQG